MIFSSKKIDPGKSVIINIDNNAMTEREAGFNPDLVRQIVNISDESTVPAVKFLGVFISNNLNFKFHIKRIMSKVTKSMYFIRTSKIFLTTQALKSLYYSLIHSHLTYAISIWSCTAPTNLLSLVKVQKKAIRLISQAKHNDHTEPLFKKLGILPLYSLIEFTKLQFMQNFIQGLLPEIIMEEWELSNNRRQNQVQVVLRNHNEIYEPFARMSFSEKLPLCSLPKIWNSFEDNSIKIIRDKIELKKNLKHIT